jgi:hypothetical protein
MLPADDDGADDCESVAYVCCRCGRLCAASCAAVAVALEFTCPLCLAGKSRLEWRGPVARLDRVRNSH